MIGEDEPEVRNYLSMAVACHGFDVATADDGSEVVSYLRSAGESVSALLLDIRMPHMDGIEAVREIRRSYSDLPIIMISGVTKPETIVEVMKCGASDFLTKPITHDQLCDALKSALPADWDAERVEDSDTADGAASAVKAGWLRESEMLIRQIGAADVPVLILGETGSGKEVFAQRLHAQSLRARKPFYKLNCAALPSELVESELFGYDRGAFTGAVQRKAGMFERADGGTLLLDEIGDMDLKLQAKLLQVLQDQTFQRLGGKETVSVDVRVLAATHRDLEKAVEAGEFREDLFYRLNVISVRVPPLRERRGEVLRLAEHFLDKHAAPDSPGRLALTPALKRALTEFAWPGNVRQLENLMRRHLVIRDPDALVAELRRLIARAAPSPVAPAAEQEAIPKPVGSESVFHQAAEAKDIAERQAILQALDATRWNRRKAAKALGIDYKGLLYRMKKLGLDSASAGAQREAGRGARQAAGAILAG